MRNLILAVLALVAVHVAAPARAQTYDPHYPFCLQIYDDMVNYTFECAYTSMEQCKASASGRNADCVVNPYAPPKNPQQPAPRQRPSPRQPPQ
jgi:Protein of unknown function (DUF3551)